MLFINRTKGFMQNMSSEHRSKNERMPLRVARKKTGGREHQMKREVRSGDVETLNGPKWNLEILLSC